MLRHFWEVLAHSGRFLKAFCVRVLASLSEGLARVWVGLKLEVFMRPSLLIKGSELKAKVQMRLKLEGGLIWRFNI